MFKHRKTKPKSINESNFYYYIVNGILFTIMVSLSRTYAVKFLYRIGGTNFHFSLFNALPGFIGIFATLPCMLWLIKSNNKKRLMGNFFWGSRLFCIIFALVPFVPASIQPMLFVASYSLMNFPETASATALQSFSGDIFKPKDRSNAISLRNKYSTLAQVIICLFIGLILKSPNSNSTTIHIYQIFFALSFLVSIFELKSFYKLKEIDYSSKTPKLEVKKDLDINIFRIFKNAFKNKKFMFFMVCSLLFHFGWQMGWPLFNIYQMKNLKADEWWLTIFNLTSSLAMVFSYNYWNKLIKTKGNAFAMAFATFGMAVTPLLYIISFNAYIMTVTGLISGFFTAGTSTVILSSLLEVSPEDEREIFVGIHATLTNITLAISPLLGNLVLVRYNIFIALAVAAFFRFIGSFALFYRSKKIKFQSIN